MQRISTALHWPSLEHLNANPAVHSLLDALRQVKDVHVEQNAQLLVVLQRMKPHDKKLSDQSVNRHKRGSLGAEKETKEDQTQQGGEKLARASRTGKKNPKPLGLEKLVPLCSILVRLIPLPHLYPVLI